MLKLLSWVIGIGLLGCYPYTHLIFYIYLVLSLMKINQFLSRVSISLHGIRAIKTLTVLFLQNLSLFFYSSPPFLSSKASAPPTHLPQGCHASSKVSRSSSSAGRGFMPLPRSTEPLFRLNRASSSESEHCPGSSA